MKKYSCILFFFLTVNLYAQVGFYVRPVIEHKFHANSGTSYNVITPQGYTLKVEPINFYPLRGLDIGLYLGYRTKNFFFETGWSQDQGSHGVRISGMSYSVSDSSFYLSDVIYKTGVAYNKIPLKIGVKLFGKDSVTSGQNWNLQGFVYGGIDFLIRQPALPHDGTDYYFITDKNLDTIKGNARLGTQLKWGYLNTIGFMLKIQNRKGYVLNLSVHYSQGSSYNQTSYSSLTFTNYDGTTYKSFISSRSSGLYLSISTDIYPLQLVKKKLIEDEPEEEQLLLKQY
jgi:hypothetical protein